MVLRGAVPPGDGGDIRRSLIKWGGYQVVCGLKMGGVDTGGRQAETEERGRLKAKKKEIMVPQKKIIPPPPEAGGAGTRGKGGPMEFSFPGAAL